MVVVLAISGTMVVSQIPAYAQFGGLGKKKTAGSGGPTITKEAFAMSADKAADNLLAARIAFLDAKVKMMEAIGVKADSVAKASEALRAKEGNTSNKVKKLETISKTTAEADKEFEAKMAESKELSAESKAKFAEGAGKFIEGVVLEKEQIETIQKLVEQGQSLAQSAGPMEKASVLSLAKPVTSMAKMVPGDVKEGSSTLSKILKYAKSQNVEIPGADKVTEKLGDL